jgi:hypothetical protein
MGAIYYVSRLGYSDNLPGPVLLNLGLSWFLIHFPFAMKQLWIKARTSSSWMASDGALSLVGLVFVMLLGMSFGKTAGVPIAVCGALFLLWRCAALTRTRWLWRVCEVLCWGSLVGICLACYVWGDGFHDPLLRWAFLNGYPHRDQPYHHSIANMIRTYGVPSSGLDGVPYLPYHYGSHFLLTQLGKLLDLPGLDAYELTYPVVFWPLMVHSVVIAGLAYALPKRATHDPRSLLVWPTLLVGFVGVVPLPSVFQTGLRWMLDLASESMFMAIIVLQLGLAAAAPLFRRDWEGCQERMSIDKLAALIGFPAFVAILGFLKISVMAVFLGASTLIYLTMGRLRRSWIAALSLALAYVAFLGVSSLVNPGASSPVRILGYLRGWVALDWWGYYVLLELQILLPAVALRLWQEKCRDVADLIKGWRSGALLDVGFAVFAAAISLMPGLILELPHLTAPFFSDVQRWIALPILLGVLLSIAHQPTEILPWKQRLWRLPLWKLGVGFLLLSIGATFVIDIALQARQLVRANLDDRGFPSINRARPAQISSGETGANRRASLKRALLRGHFGRAYALIQEQAADEEARKDARAQTIKMLISLYRLPEGEKRVTLLHIPKTNRAYWDLLDISNPPWVTPFVAPALSGLALLDGLPEPEDWPEGGLYGYRDYNRSNETMRSPGRDKSVLCAKAQMMGFKRVLVLDVDSGGGPQLHEWCLEGARPLFDR